MTVSDQPSQPQPAHGKGLSSNAMTAIMVVGIFIALAIMQVAQYVTDAQQAPVRACERLDGQELVADCLAGLDR